MDNAQKIQLLQLRLTALSHEERTLSLLEDSAKLMRLHGGQAQGFDEVRAMLTAARSAYNEELHARQTSGFFARRRAVSDLRAAKPALYGAHHKMANVSLEEIRQAIDKFEASLGYDREDGVMLFNTSIRQLRATGIPQAVVVPSKAVYETARVRLGSHIFINKYFGGALAEADLLAFHLTLLRNLRRIAQTSAGQRLLRELDEAATSLKRHYPQSEELLRIDLGSSNKDWVCQSPEQDDATARGRPTITSIPKERGGRQGAQRGTGRGSRAIVTTFPRETVQIGSRDGANRAEIPAHVALFHELTHALRSLRGEQDHTYLSERPSQIGDTFAHAGFWFTAEERFTVAAEKEYSEQTGFTLKRLNYGQLGERIDR